MNTFFKTNKNLITYSLIFLLIIPIFGLNFLMSFVGNILLLILLIPLLLLLIGLISFNTLKSKVNICNQCGAVSFGSSNSNACVRCGTNLDSENSFGNEFINNPGERTIEVKAEEVN